MGISKNYTTTFWNQLLQDNAPDLDRGKLLAWIQEESGGFPQALGAVYEVGIGQLDLQDGPAYGGTLASLHSDFCESPSSTKRVRDLTDDEEILQVTSLAAMARDYLTVADSQLAAIGQTWSDDDRWALAKLRHGLPGIAKSFLRPANDAGSADDFQAFEAWVMVQSHDVLYGIDHGTTAYMSRFGAIFANAEAVGYAESLGLGDLASGHLSHMGRGIATLALFSAACYLGARYGMV